MYNISLNEQVIQAVEKETKEAEEEDDFEW